MSILALKQAVHDYMEAAQVPTTEFSADFAVKMLAAMMVSFHKYGRVAQAYPDKFDALGDVRARLNKYRETGDKQYLVDAANFYMIEAMHPRRPDAHWGVNDDLASIGRTSTENRQLRHEDNAGNRILQDRT